MKSGTEQNRLLSRTVNFPTTNFNNKISCAKSVGEMTGMTDSISQAVKSFTHGGRYNTMFALGGCMTKKSWAEEINDCKNNQASKLVFCHG
jgi:hypothetical protein